MVIELDQDQESKRKQKRSKHIGSDNRNRTDRTCITMQTQYAKVGILMQAGAGVYPPWPLIHRYASYEFPSPRVF